MPPDFRQLDPSGFWMLNIRTVIRPDFGAFRISSVQISDNHCSMYMGIVIRGGMDAMGNGSFLNQNRKIHFI